MRPFSDLKNNNEGVVAIIVALGAIMLLGILLLAIDLSGSQNAYQKSQGAADASALATGDLIYRTYARTGKITLTQDDIAYAKKVYVGSLVDQKAAALIDSTFNVAIDANNILTVSACVQTNNQYDLQTSNSTSKECTKAAVKIQNIPQIEVAIPVDNGAVVNGTMTAAQKIADEKAAINTLTASLQQTGTSNFKTGITVSLLPYSDTVRLTNTGATPNLLNTANSWNRTPYASFIGCMGMHNNAYDATDDAPGTNATNYDRYLGLIGPTVAFYGAAHPNIPVRGFQYTSYDPNTGIMTFNPDGVRLPRGYLNPLAVRARFSDGSSDRFWNQIDYMKTTGTSERLEINLGGPYANAIQDVAIGDFGGAGNEGSGPAETGTITFLDSSRRAIRIVNISGGNGQAHTYTIRQLGVPASTPFQYIEFTATNNGGGYHWGPTTPDQGQVQYWAKVEDNSDYSVNSFTLPFNCNLTPSILLTNNKSIIDGTVNAMTADGPIRNNIGVAWAFRALSTKFAGLWNGNSSQPSATAQKFMIIVSQNADSNPGVDNQEMINACTNAKAEGIKIFYVTLTADATTQSLGQQCASPNSFYNATSVGTLANYLSSIGSSISANTETVKLVK